MGRPANFKVVQGFGERHRPLVIRDVGPWAVHLTITNDAERVVERLYLGGELLCQQRLLYYDSEGELGELVTDGHGTFVRFRPADGCDLAEAKRKEVK